jgi:hypothetical protein
MNNIAIKSFKDKVVVTFDKTASNVDILLRFLERLEIEQTAKKIDFSRDIIKIADEIKTKKVVIDANIIFSLSFPYWDTKKVKKNERVTNSNVLGRMIQ